MMTTKFAVLTAACAVLAFCFGFSLPLQAQARPSAVMLAAGQAATGAAEAATAPDPVRDAVASPPPSSQLPDPEQAPGDWIDAFRAWWGNGGKVPAALVVLIGLLRVTSRRVAWLRTGWREAGVAVALVGVGTLLDTWLSSGAAGNLTTWLLGGVFAVIGYLINPRPAPQPLPEAVAK